MKRLFLIFLLSILSVGCVYAQKSKASAYVLSVDTEQTYQAITDGTELGANKSGFEWDRLSFTKDGSVLVTSCDPTTVATIPLNFSFPFADSSFTGVAINANGILFLGQDSVSPGFAAPLRLNSCANTVYTIFCMPSNSGTAIGSYKKTETDRSHIVYKTEKIADVNWFKVEYKNVLIRNIKTWPTRDTSIDTVSFQIMLGSNGKIRYHFDSLTYNKVKNGSYTYDVGIKGNMAKVGYTSYFDYAVIGSRTSWVEDLSTFTPASGYSIPSTLPISSSIQPPKNLLYEFTQPEECTKPAAPGEISLSNIGTSSVSIVLPTFTSETEKDRSMLLIGPSNTVLSVKDGTDYTLYDSIGSARMISSIYSMQVSLNDLEPSTEYRVFAVNYNNLCSNGPKYSVVTTADFKTLLQAPTELKISYTDTNSLHLKTTTANNYQVLICIPGKSPAMVNIPSDVAVGDVLNNGDTVIYKGNAGTFIYSGLKAASPYNFRAYSIHQNADKLEYSADYLSVADRTTSQLPLRFNFNDFPNVREQAGFISFLKTADSTSLYKFQKTEYDNPDFTPCFEAQINTMGMTTRPDVTDIVLPSVHLGKGKHRLVFDKAFLTPPQRPKPTGPYTFNNSDSLLIQISTRLEEESFKTIYTLNKENYSETTDQFTNTMVNIEGFTGEKVYLRLVFYTQSKVYSRLTNFKVEEFLDCETPIQVSVIEENLTNSSAHIDWTQLEGVAEATSYNVQYLLNDTWSESYLSEKKPAYINGLPTGSIISARVQANCGEEEHSFWSDPSPSFRTLYSLPYFDDLSELTSFDNLSRWGAYEIESFLLSESEEPINIKTHEFSRPTDPDYILMSWRAQEEENPSITLPLTSWVSSFVCVPEIFLTDATQKKVLSFDLSVNNQYTENTIDEEIHQNITVYVLLTETPYVFDKSNIIATYGANSTPTLAEMDSLHIELDLTKYQGKVQIALYAENAGDDLYSTSLFVDNISFDYVCKLPSELKAEDIDKNSAKLSWESPGEKSILNYWIKGSTTIEDTIVLENAVKTYTLTNLISGASYVWSIQNACEGDTYSPAVTAEFKTTYCDTISSSRVKSNNKTQTVIAWEGEASIYRLRYREVDSTSWKIIRSTSKEATCSNLKPGTQYEYSIQSQCSADDSTDVSLWSQNKKFRTLYLSCYEPSEFKAHQVMWNRAILSWKSDAVGVEIYVAKENGRDSAILEIGAEDTCIIANLTPKTSYKAVIRAVCAPGDESEWTDTIRFTTADIPACTPPTELSVEVLSKSSAKLSWVAGSNNNTFHISYRETEKAWDTVKSLKEASYTISDLKTNVVYQWRVQGICEEVLFSTWAEGDSFTCVSIEGNEESTISVFSKNHQIHILNPSAIEIDKVEVYSVNGQILFSSEIHAKDHLIIPLEKTDNIRIIRIYSGKQILTHKIFIQ